MKPTDLEAEYSPVAADAARERARQAVRAARFTPLTEDEAKQAAARLAAALGVPRKPRRKERRRG